MLAFGCGVARSLSGRSCSSAGGAAELIEELEASLPAEVDDPTLAVINERIARAIAGEPGIPGEEVFAEARRR